MSDKAFKKIIIVVALLATIWGCIPAKSEYKVNGKVITLVEHGGAKKSEPHDSITGYTLQTSKGTFEVFRGRRGGLYVWAGGKKTYLPKKVKAQLNNLSKSDK
jgi:hypothetical protein